MTTEGFRVMRPYRKEKLASIIRQVISEAIVHRLSDPRIAPLTTVTRVELTSDLQIAKVYLSVQGGDVVERRTLIAMRHAAGYLQRMVAGELSIRQCPELRLDLDQGMREVKRMMELLAENRRNDPTLIEREGDDDPASPLRAETGELDEGGSAEMSEGVGE